MNIPKTLALAFSCGNWSGLMSMATLVWASRAVHDHPLTGVNAPSHWFLGEPAVHRQGFSARHTVLGALTHQASAYFWGVGFASFRTRRGADEHSDMRVAIEAAAMTALAATVDLAVVPKRLTPGFERRLGTKELIAVYVAFGIGLFMAARRARDMLTVPPRQRSPE